MILYFVAIFTVNFSVSAQTKLEKPIIYILDSTILNKIENSGFSLAETMGHPQKITTTQELYNKVTYYKNFANQIGKPIAHNSKTDQLPKVIPHGQGDIPEMVKAIRGIEDKGKRSDKDKKSAYKIQELANNSHYPYQLEYDGDEPRYFDIRWLYSPFAQFKLIGIANRIDRMDFNPNTCGELRFIYRLSYRSPMSASSLPFFLNVVHKYPKAKDCKQFAQKWYLKKLTVENLLKGPLSNTSFQQLELNFQSLRFTSGYMHDFGGQAMYIQRIFKIIDNELQPIPLENTPNVLALEKDKKLFSKFISFLKKEENLKALDEGYLNINFDPQFLSKISLSWSTLGRARTANRPYSKLYQTYKKDFDSIDISKLKFIKSTNGLIERLNNLTCAGCHQAGGTAGFHFLGYPDPKFSHPFNRQELALSPHGEAEIHRRESYLDAIINDKVPNRFRPHSILKSENWKTIDAIPKFSNGKVGSLCFKDNSDFLTNFKCQNNKEIKSKCQLTVLNDNSDVAIGECVQVNKASAGNLCWKGNIKENFNKPHSRKNSIETFNFYSFQDKWKLLGPTFKSKQEYKCVLPQSGAPLGRMSRSCSLEEEKFNYDPSQPAPSELCANQGGKGFDLCAASGNAGACLESKVARSMLDVCHPERYCREDYICQRFPDYSKISEKDYVRKKGNILINKVKPNEIRGDLISKAHKNHIGFCVPTYFLFNMRLDGHPNPLTGKSPESPKFDRTKPLRGYK